MLDQETLLESWKPCPLMPRLLCTIWDAMVGAWPGGFSPAGMAPCVRWAQAAVTGKSLTASRFPRRKSLWYRALLARAFFDTPGGPQEFAYIPTDLLSLLPVSQGTADLQLGRPATPAERPIYNQPLIASWMTPAPCWLLCGFLSR